MTKDDATLAGDALRKKQAGERPTAREREALTRWTKQRDDRDRLRHYAECPKRVYLDMAATTAKVVIEHAERHSFPLIGPTVDLAAVIHRLHEFIKENRFKLAADDDPLMSGSDSPHLEKYRKYKANLAELEYYRRLGNWIPREDVHSGLGECAAILRRAGETLQRQFGPDALDVIRGALEEFRAVILVRFAESAGEETKETPNDNANGDGKTEPKRRKRKAGKPTLSAGKRKRRSHS